MYATKKENELIPMIGNYNGGKGNIFRHLINQIPPHRRYIEAFIGGGSVMLNKKAAAVNVGIDMDTAVIAAWQRWTQPPQTAMAAVTAINGGNYRYAPPQTAVATTAENGAASAQPEMETGAATTTNGGAAPQYIFLNTSALTWLDNATITPTDFIYADPPYLMHTRSYQRPLYNHEFSTPEEHEALLRRLLKLDCMIMISGYWSELYADLLRDWRTLQIETYDRAGNPKTEWLYMNYAEPKRLHDYQWLGENADERWKLERRKRRAIRKYSKMPRLERLYLMSALEEAGLLD